MKQVKGESTSLLVQVLFMAVAAGRVVRELMVLGLSEPHGQVRSKVRSRFTSSEVRSRFALCTAGMLGLTFASYSVGGSWRHRGMERWMCVTGMQHTGMECWRRTAGVLMWSV